MIPTLYHTGGDWWFSAMERLWWFVAHYEEQDRERRRSGYYGIATLVREMDAEWLRDIAHVATGGNPPKRVDCAPYCRCAKHYSNIVPPEEV